MASASARSSAARASSSSSPETRERYRALRDELLVGADGCEAALVEDGDAVCEVKRRTAVRHEERRSTLHDHPQGGVDPLLHPGVDGARGVVEDQDARVRQDRGGKRHPLTLAAREREPSLAYDGVVAPRQLLDEVVRLGCPGCGLDLLQGRIWPAVGDVRPDAV